MLKKRILLIVLIVLSISQSTNTKADNGDSQDGQSISDRNSVSFSLIQEEDSCAQESEVDYDIETIQKITELDRQIEILNQIEDTYKWFKKYKELKEEFSTVFIEENEHKPITEEYTQEEIYYIERMVETETHGCSFDAHVNVANVAFNRIDHEKFPNDPIGVVTSDGQFCYGKTKISESVKLAVEYAYMFPDTTNGAIYFHSGRRTKTFNKKPLVHEDDALHYFYG